MSNNITEIKVKKLKDGAELPTKGHAEDAGFDLYACLDHTIVIEPHKTVLVGTGIAVELPKGTFGAVFARSGLATKSDLAPANKVGVVDNPYRGEIMVALHNHGESIRVVANGDRIAQLVVMPYVMSELIWSDELSDSERGDGGFGSTGK